MTKAHKGGLSILLLGPPGTGKSEFAASAAAAGLRCKLLALRPKEIDSRGYVEHGINEDAELFHDPGWMPSIGEYEATAFVQLLRRLRDLQSDDEVDVVIIDPLTDVNEIIAHELLKIEQEGDYGDTSNSIALWGQHRKRFTEIIKAATYLTHAAHPKHVICLMHTAPTNDDNPLSNKETSDKRAKGIKYFGEVLPQMQGSYKYDIGGEFQLVGFTDFQQGKRKNEEKSTKIKPVYESFRDFGIIWCPDKDRFAKAALYGLDDERTPNDFGALLNAINREEE